MDFGAIGKGYAARSRAGGDRGRRIRRAMVGSQRDLAIGDPHPGRAAGRFGIDDSGRAASLRAEVDLLQKQRFPNRGPRSRTCRAAGVKYAHPRSGTGGMGLTRAI